MDEEKFIELFRKAVNTVDNIYYGKNGWDEIDLNLDEIVDNSKREILRKFLSRYGERPFCYELYHQIRLQMEDYLEKHPKERDTGICLQAEIKKDQIRESLPYLREIKNPDLFSEIEPLDKEYMPDFLLHASETANFEHQIAVVEVKSNHRLSFSGFKEDLSKIQEFITQYNFRQGIFLTVNTSPERMYKNLSRPESLRWIREELPNRSQILFICKEHYDAELVEYNLGDLEE